MRTGLRGGRGKKEKCQTQKRSEKRGGEANTLKGHDERKSLLKNEQKGGFAKRFKDRS